jgi:hypothetical protein
VNPQAPQQQQQQQHPVTPEPLSAVKVENEHDGIQSGAPREKATSPESHFIYPALVSSHAGVGAVLDSKAPFASTSAVSSQPVVSVYDATVLVGPSTELDVKGGVASSDANVKSPLFDGMESLGSWQTKSPQDWNQNDVTTWLEHNAISKPSVEAFKGEITV